MLSIFAGSANLPLAETVAALGPYPYRDSFKAPDNETAATVAAIVRSFGHATAVTWPITPWEPFRGALRATG